MNTSISHKILRVLYYFSTILLIILSVTKIRTTLSTLYLDDYIFFAILIISFILINKYSIRLKSTNLNFSDFIVIICYMKFDLYITILAISASYLITFFIEFKNSKDLNLITENTQIFNCSMVITSLFVSNYLLNIVDGVYSIRIYSTITVILFSLFMMSLNYILYCIELSLLNKSIVLITLESGLYFIFLNFFISTTIASFSLFVYSFYGYMPVVAMTAFIIFISFSFNTVDRLKVSNTNFKTLSECTAFLISKADFKIKAQHVIQTIETIVPFVYCGIYFTREKYNYIYPISYKFNILASLDSTLFRSSSDNNVFTQIMSGIPIYKESSYFGNSIGLVNTFPDKTKYALAIPIRDSDSTTGFALICIDRHLDLTEEIEILSTLTEHLGMVNFHININMRNNNIGYKNYDSLTRYIDYNIKYKIFFTLAVLEIDNYLEIIQTYNRDFYETFKNELSRLISKFLSPSDLILCFDKENIYIVFNLLDAENSLKKLEEISEFLKYYKYKDIPIETKISYAVTEYPMEAVNSDEILSSAYRKLQYKKMPD